MIKFFQIKQWIYIRWVKTSARKVRPKSQPLFPVAIDGKPCSWCKLKQLFSLTYLQSSAKKWSKNNPGHKSSGTPKHRLAQRISQSCTIKIPEFIFHKQFFASIKIWDNRLQRLEGW